MAASSQDTARALLETIPPVMQVIRRELRSHRAQDLSVPQFRVLTYLKGHCETSLSPVADHIGLTLPSMSSLVDGLVERGLVKRETSRQDRRKVTLSLSDEGKALLEYSHSHTLAFLTVQLDGLDIEGRDTVLQALQILQTIFLRPGDCQPRQP